jgi:hypothetical protein
MLFDFVLVFHPGYESKFRNAGHAGARFVAHAVDAQQFAGPEMERIYDVGWVGQTTGPIYHKRGPILNELSKSFRMNNAKRRYSLEEMALSMWGGTTIRKTRTCGRLRQWRRVLCF